MSRISLASECSFISLIYHITFCILSLLLFDILYHAIYILGKIPWNCIMQKINPPPPISLVILSILLSKFNHYISTSVSDMITTRFYRMCSHHNLIKLAPIFRRKKMIQTSKTQRKCFLVFSSDFLYFLVFPNTPQCSVLFAIVSWCSFCSLVFPRVPQYSLVFPSVPQCSLVFPSVPQRLLVFPSVPNCFLMLLVFPSVTQCSIVFPCFSQCYIVFPRAPWCS